MLRWAKYFILPMPLAKTVDAVNHQQFNFGTVGDQKPLSSEYKIICKVFRRGKCSRYKFEYNCEIQHALVQ